MDSSNSYLLSNPLDLTHGFTSPAAQPTRTLGARTVYHEAQAALRPLLTNVQTQEQLDTLVEHISDIRSVINPSITLQQLTKNLPQGTQKMPKITMNIFMILQ